MTSDGTTFTREGFARQRAAVKAVERREGWMMAGISVGLGVAQLLFIRWGDTNLSPDVALPLYATFFVAYMVLVGLLVRRYTRKLRAVRPRCPQCGVVLEGVNERVASATGRCEACGGQVIA